MERKYNEIFDDATISQKLITYHEDVPKEKQLTPMELKFLKTCILREPLIEKEEDENQNQGEDDKEKEKDKIQELMEINYEFAKNNQAFLDDVLNDNLEDYLQNEIEKADF